MSEVLRTIASSGGDYTSLAALLSGMAGSVGSGNHLVGRYVGAAFADTTSDIYFGDGTLSGGALYWQIEADAANTYTGEAFTTSKVRLTGGLLNANENGDVRFVGLQFAESTSFAFRIQDSSQLLIDRCGVTSTTRGVLCWGGTLLARNSMFAGPTAGAIIADNSGAVIVAHNVTAANAAFNQFSGSFTVRNCIAYGGFSGTFGGSSSNNASNGGSAPGSGGITGIASSVFLDYGSADYRSAAFLGAGADLSADSTLPVTIDVESGLRPSAPSIGFYEPPYVIALSPVDGATGVSTTATLAAQFSKTVALGSGDWTVNATGGATHDTVAAGSTSLSTTTQTNDTVTIPHTTLSGSTAYDVQWAAGVLVGLAANASTTAWNFTTDAGGGTTVTATGSAATVTAAAGTATLAVVVSATGAAAGVATAAGTTATAAAVAATGSASSVATAAGIAIPAGAVAATGSTAALAVASGTAVPETGITVPATGSDAAVATAAGQIAVAATLTATGQAASVAALAGTVVPSATVDGTGAGAGVSVASGTVTPGSAVTVVATGAAAGIVAVAGSVVPASVVLAAGSGATIGAAAGEAFVPGEHVLADAAHTLADALESTTFYDGAGSTTYAD